LRVRFGDAAQEAEEALDLLGLGPVAELDDPGLADLRIDHRPRHDLVLDDDREPMLDRPVVLGEARPRQRAEPPTAIECEAEPDSPPGQLILSPRDPREVALGHVLRVEPQEDPLAIPLLPDGDPVATEIVAAGGEAKPAIPFGGPGQVVRE